jgi:hypothetical protein
MISELTKTGCVIAIRAQHAAGSHVSLDVPGIGPVEAVVLAREGGSLRCRFVDPLDDAALTLAARADARSGGEIVERWPRPARVAIAIGGAALLWGAIGWALS